MISFNKACKIRDWKVVHGSMDTITRTERERLFNFTMKNMSSISMEKYVKFFNQKHLIPTHLFVCHHSRFIYCRNSLLGLNTNSADLDQKLRQLDSINA